MRFRFIGDPRHGGDGPDHVRIGGFPIGRHDFVEVPDYLAERLMKNSHFEAEPEGGETLKAPIDGLSDHKKRDLLAEADRLGIDVDRRWGPERLARAISDAIKSGSVK